MSLILAASLAAALLAGILVAVARQERRRAASAAPADDAVDAAPPGPSVRLAVSNERVVTDEDQAVCPTCASLVVGALDGDPCPACGTSVTELPRIRPGMPPPIRRGGRSRRTL